MGNDKLMTWTLNPGGKPSVLLVEGGRIQKSRLVAGLEELWGCRIPTCSSHDPQLERKFDACKPDIGLIRTRVDEDQEHSLAILRRLVSNRKSTAFVLLGDRFDARLAFTAFRGGVQGFIEEAGQSAEIFGKCLQCVSQGQFWISNDLLAQVMRSFSRPPENAVPLSTCGDVLSPREKEVMNLILEGLGNREIADVLRISENTVKKYVYEVFNKRGVSNRVALLRQAFQHERNTA